MLWVLPQCPFIPILHKHLSSWGSQQSSSTDAHPLLPSQHRDSCSLWMGVLWFPGAKTLSMQYYIIIMEKKKIRRYFKRSYSVFLFFKVRTALPFSCPTCLSSLEKWAIGEAQRLFSDVQNMSNLNLLQPWLRSLLTVHREQALLFISAFCSPANCYLVSSAISADFFQFLRSLCNITAHL